MRNITKSRYFGYFNCPGWLSDFPPFWPAFQNRLNDDVIESGAGRASRQVIFRKGIVDSLKIDLNKRLMHDNIYCIIFWNLLFNTECACIYCLDQGSTDQGKPVSPGPRDSVLVLEMAVRWSLLQTSVSLHTIFTH